MDKFTVTRALLEGLVCDDFRQRQPAQAQAMALLARRDDEEFDIIAEGDTDWCVAALRLRNDGWNVKTTGLAAYAYFFKEDFYGPLYPSVEAAWRALALVVELPPEQETIEYSVCEECMLFINHGESPNALHIDAAMKRELGGRAGYFNAGVEPTEDDPDGTGYDEFSGCACELCNDTLAGSRYGATLLFTEG